MGQLRWPRAARRLWVVTGLVALALSAVVLPAAADDRSCSGSLAERLDCWAGRVGAQDASVLVTLRKPLALDGKAADWKLSQRKATFDRGPLVLMVPAGHPTGAGGTLLLVLAGDRLVDPDAEITRLDDKTVGALREAGACEGKLCEAVAAAKGKDKPLRGKELVEAGLAAELDRNSDSVGGSGGGSSLLVPALGVAALLLLLVTALVLAVRRSRGPRLAFAVPAAGRPPAARTGRTGTASTAGMAEAPGRHRAAPGRDVRRPTAPGRVAVVRTALHPQGYVELDQCLRRAVWAEPGTPAPAPGARVEVSEGRGKDAGILYAHAYAENGRTVIDRAQHGS
ncbi:hypothetical protein [Streptomyces sp. BPTC-684]|uniref:hypothetical protein n=1 Tax=Streptomyces sp. BPTC-684 TaxID=3043734 RepID=UPI0024B10F33|nr:hypothetical protein [Streptomyces sp. BPTC-684]WHM36914.1 hypothetical protein QIY60_08430 [Streptomyces sp. BPTC-684]